MRNSTWNGIGDVLLAVVAMMVTPFLMSVTLFFATPTGCGEPLAWWMWAVPLVGMILGPLAALRVQRSQMETTARLEALRS